MGYLDQLVVRWHSRNLHRLVSITWCLFSSLILTLVLWSADETSLNASSWSQSKLWVPCFLWVCSAEISPSLTAWFFLAFWLCQQLLTFMVSARQSLISLDGVAGCWFLFIFFLSLIKVTIPPFDKSDLTACNCQFTQTVQMVERMQKHSCVRGIAQILPSVYFQMVFKN